MQGLPDWNAIRYDSERPRGHVESYFVKANDAEGRRALWLKATIIASSTRPAHAMAEAWAVVFDRQGKHVAVKESVPFAAASFSREGLAVDIGKYLRFDSGGTRGGIGRGEHEVSWDLSWKRNGGALVHFPVAKMYSGAFPKSKLVTPYPDLDISGSITVDGQKLDIKSWRGMQGHNWGRGHADLYAWGQCNRWDQDVDTMVEAVSARVRVGPVLTPLITMVCVRHEGKEYRLSRPRHLMRNRGEVHPRRWFFGAKERAIAVEGDFSAQTDDFVGLYYPNPDGQMTYCLNTKIAHGRVRIELPGREPLDLTTHGAALELGTKDASHGVQMYV
jgi:Tocopherol cyclase